MRVFSDLFSGQGLGRGVNESFIFLIPKKEGAEGLNDYRLISLIGSVYKIGARVLSRRLATFG